MNIKKVIKITALFLSIQTIVWVALTALSMSQVQSHWQPLDYIKWVSQPDRIFVLNYINALLLTLVVVALFSFLYLFLKENFETASLAGFIFIPIYGVMNIVSYGIQISVVPAIAQRSIGSPSMELALQLIQAYPFSLIGFINGLAYGILGISSIIFGVLLIKETKKFSGLFLMINGILCILGVAGYILRNQMLSMGVALGGVVFLISLVSMVIEFRES